jgi:hypothetical protein
MSTDSVFDKSRENVFNGTPAETKQFLQDNPSEKHLDVVTGDTLEIKSIPEYLGE